MANDLLDIAAKRLQGALSELEEAKLEFILKQTSDGRILEKDIVLRAQNYMRAKYRYTLAEHDFKRLNREVLRLGKWEGKL